TVAKDIAAQVASTISNLKESNIDPEKACISDDESFIQLKYSDKLAGGITLSGENILKIMPIPNCAKVTVKTKIKEKLTIETSLLQNSTGINEEDVWLQKEAEPVEINEKISFNEEDLQQDARTGEYFKEFFVCAKASTNSQLINAQNEKIRVSAFSSENTQRKSNIHEITINICAVDPVTSVTTAIERFNKGDGSTFWQIDAWDPQKGKTITSDELRKMLSKEGIITLNDDGSITIPELATKEGRNQKIKGTIAYGVVCGAACSTCAALASTVGLLTTWGDCAWTCGITTAYEGLKIFGLEKDIEEVTSSIWSSVKETTANITGKQLSNSGTPSINDPNFEKLSTNKQDSKLFAEGV
ncbi:MAG: hypothetical protein Q7K42_06365, partial [Candidatus Diapherotrites archaeon]|nr:hypothetical protein [Candidatus Diapherotrites archaeon]